MGAYPSANIVPRLFSLPRFWILLVSVPCMALLRDLVWRYYQRTWHPKSYHIVQEMQKYRLQDVHPRTDEFQKYVARMSADAGTSARCAPCSACAAAAATRSRRPRASRRGSSGSTTRRYRARRGSNYFFFL